MEKSIWESVVHIAEKMTPGILTAAADMKFTEEEIKYLAARFACEVLDETGRDMTEEEAIKVFEAILIIIKVAKS